MLAEGMGMTLAGLQDFLARAFPQAFGPGRPHAVTALAHHAATVRLDAGDEQLRPGGTVSGPAMMGLADVAAYAAILGAVGEVPLAVTTNFSINFLRKPAPGPLFAEARLMKLGRRLAVCNVDIITGADRALCAHVVTTYSIPVERS